MNACLRRYAVKTEFGRTRAGVGDLGCSARLGDEKEDIESIV